VCCLDAAASSSDELQACLETLKWAECFGLQAIFSLEFVVYRFVLQENITLFQNVLKVETAENVRHTIHGMLLWSNANLQCWTRENSGFRTVLGR
jgi:hypothetical protein